VLAPILILGGNAGYELLHPAAVVLLGGLVTATLVNLVVLPVLYLRLEPSAATEASEETDSDDYQAVLVP
jgi:Cu/Ag efflux pump CusA